MSSTKAPNRPAAGEHGLSKRLSRTSHDHALVGAGALSGAAAGAVVGAVAGPVGILAGSAIGSAVGAIAGVAMEREDVRRDAHDRELDVDIGVTSGSLGTPTETKRPSRATLEEAAERDEVEWERSSP